MSNFILYYGVFLFGTFFGMSLMLYGCRQKRIVITLGDSVPDGVEIRVVPKEPKA